jgi:protocatechuate 3,4-dioxygenase beta subunit
MNWKRTAGLLATMSSLTAWQLPASPRQPQRSSRAEPTRSYPAFAGRAGLTGVALRADGKSSWAGAKVELFFFGEDGETPSGPPDREPERSTTTDRQGRFAFHRLPDGRYWLRVTQEKGGTETATGSHRAARVDLEGDRAASLRVVMADLTLEGQVLIHAGGAPVAGAQVEVYRESRYGNGGASAQRVASRTADAEGRFQVTGLDPGDYRLDAKTTGPAGEEVGRVQVAVPPAGFALAPDLGEEIARVQVAVPEGGLAAPVEVVLRLYTVRGIVHGVDGAPARDALVVLGRDEREGVVVPLRPEEARNVEVARTDAGGRFEIGPVGRSRSGGHWLFARGADGTSAAMMLRLNARDEQPESVELHLTRRAIVGTIIDADGKPIPDVLVRSWRLNPEPGYRQSDLCAKTDADGRFRFHGCDAGTFRLTPRKDRLVLAPAVVTVPADAEATVQLKHVTTAVEGVVVRPDGKPWSKARVSMGGQQATTDEAGRFRLSGLLPGKQSVWIRDASGRHSRTVQVTADPTDSTKPIRLVLPDYAPSVVLAIQRPDGKPAARAKVHAAMHVLDADGSPESYGVRDVVLGAEGRLRHPLEVPREGRLQYVVLVPGVGCAQPSVLEITGLERDKVVPVRLRPAASIRGVVKGETTGKPVGGVMLTPYQKADGSPEPRLWNFLFRPHPTGDDSIFPVTASRDGDGTFALEPLAAGTYELKVWDAFGHKHTETVQLAEGEHRKNMDLRVPAPSNAASVSGRLVRPDGKPVANQEVHLRLWGTWSNREPSTPEFFEGSGKLRRVVTDARGRFRLDPLPRRPLVIVAGERIHVDEYGIVASLDRGPVENARLVVPPKRR